MMTKIFAQISVFGIIGILLSSCASMYLKQGTEAYHNLRYAEAIDKLEKGLAQNPIPEKRLILADSYMEVNEFQKAVNAYESAMVSPQITDEDRLNYGRALMSVGRYQKAEEIFDGILSRDQGNPVAQKLKMSCRRVAEMKEDSTLYKVDMVMIQSLVTYYSPVLYNDGLLFSGQKSSANEKDPYNKLAYLDLYFTQLENGNWTAPSGLSEINKQYHDGIASTTEDGNTMVLTRSDYGADGRLVATADNYNNPQLYITTKNEEGEWNVPTPLPFNDKQFVVAHPAISADGKTLFFSSNMSGEGGMDLFVVEKEGDSWGEPTNLSSVVNTPGNEVFPYLKSADTLYFSSNAQQTLGGLDFLYSVKRNGKWTEPYHMDYPINSSYDDFGIAFKSDGKSGYLSSNRSGQDRIFSFQIFEPEIIVEGLVSNKNSMLPIDSVKVTIQNLTDGTEEVVYTDEKGLFSMELKSDKEYNIIAEKDDYFNVTEKLSTKGVTSDEQLQTVLEMEGLIISDPKDADEKDTAQLDEKDKADSVDDNTDETDVADENDQQEGENKDAEFANYPYVVPNIYWDFDKATIREDAKPYLNQLAKKLKDNPGLRIRILSHADCRGTIEYNDDLSQQRASAVVRYLITKGIDRSRLESEGKGERDLVNDCDCSEGRYACSEAKHQENRRTEFLVIDKK